MLSFVRGLFKYDCKQFHNFLHKYATKKTGKRFYKGLYVTFKLAPDLKKNTVYLSSCSPLNEGHVDILTNIYQLYRRAYNSSIKDEIS